MKSVLLAFLGFVLAACGLRADAVCAQLDEPGAAVDLAAASPEWRELFDKLAPHGPVFSRFTENRWFPFKKIPVVLKGEMRMAPDRGLSLHYIEPEVRTLIMDERGLVLRDERGRNREIPPDPRAASINTALLPVLHFDREELAKSFTVRAVREGEAWRLDFEPRDAALAKTLGRIVAWGEGARIVRLEFRRSGSQRVEIVIEESRVGATFSAEDLKRFFR